jgi:DNA-binding MarR family transcriptional regulator
MTNHPAADYDAQQASDVAARLAIVVGRISRRTRVSPGQLSYGMLSALSTIVRLGPLRPGDLARAEVVTKPTMTRILGELEAKGFIERADDPSDARAFLVSATTEGIVAVESARSERAGIVAELIHELPAADLAAITAALPALELVAKVGQESVTA